LRFIVLVEKIVLGRKLSQNDVKTENEQFMIKNQSNWIEGKRIIARYAALRLVIDSNTHGLTQAIHQVYTEGFSCW